MSTATIEKTHQINPTGQTGIWKHSQNVEDDLLKRFVVQVRTLGWLSMKSFHSEAEAIRYYFSGAIDKLYKNPVTLRIWDDKANEEFELY